MGRYTNKKNEKEMNDELNQLMSEILRKTGEFNIDSLQDIMDISLRAVLSSIIINDLFEKGDRSEFYKKADITIAVEYSLKMNAALVSWYNLKERGEKLRELCRLLDISTCEIGDIIFIFCTDYLKYKLMHEEIKDFTFKKNQNFLNRFVFFKCYDQNDEKPENNISLVKFLLKKENRDLLDKDFVEDVIGYCGSKKFELSFRQLLTAAGLNVKEDKNEM